MSELSRNRLFSRRGFMRRAAGTAAAGATLVSLRALAARPEATNPWAYDDTIYRRTDPKLVKYEEKARFSVAHSSPRCICLTKDERLVVGAGRFVCDYTLDGKLLSEFSLADEVRCIAERDDLLYVGLREHIEVYERSGKRKEVWDTPGSKSYFTALAVSEKDLFAADAGNRVVLRYDRFGKLKGRIGDRRKEPPIPGFIVPSPFFDVALAPDGLLRVTNAGWHSVEAYTFDGDLEFAWGKPGAAIENFCGCCNPIKLAFLTDGRVVTFEKGIPRVKIHGPDGKFESVVAGAESFPENAKVCGPNDCTLGGLSGVVDSKGQIYILDLVAANVRRMTRKPTAT